MAVQLTAGAAALRLFFTEDIYLVDGEEPAAVKPFEGIQAQAQPVLTAAQPETPAASALEDARPASPIAPVTPANPITPAPSVAKLKPVITAEFKYLGKNQKNVLILVNDAQHEVSTEQGRELLRKLVKAIDLTANDFALLNYSGYKGTDFSTLSTYFSSKLVLMFGVNPAEIGLHDLPQHEISVHNTIQLVYTTNLDELAADQQGKKVLWGSLQKLK